MDQGILGSSQSSCIPLLASPTESYWLGNTGCLPVLHTPCSSVAQISWITPSRLREGNPACPGLFSATKSGMGMRLSVFSGRSLAAPARMLFPQGTKEDVPRSLDLPTHHDNQMPCH